MAVDPEGRWRASEEFLAKKLNAAQAEMDTPILNRARWDKLRDDCRMLVFLRGRAGAVDFQGVREELNRITEGSLRVLEISGPRRKAADCLQLWATDLQALDRASSPLLSAAPIVSREL